MLATHTCAQYHIFLIKCYKGYKLFTVALKNKKRSIFLCQLPKCMIIPFLIDVLVLISHSSDKIYLFCFSHDWYPEIYTICLQMIAKMCIILAGDWQNRQWFCRGSMKSKHNTLFPKYMIIFQQISKIDKFFFNWWSANFSSWLIFFKCMIFFFFINTPFLQNMSKFRISWWNKNFSWGWYLLNEDFFTLIHYYFIENLQNSLFYATKCQNVNFSCRYFLNAWFSFPWISYYSLENW